jgi:predicted amidohydrolase YtcJ
MLKTLLALAALVASSSALADTLVTNANGVQVDANGKLERFSGVLIGDDGKVKRVLRGEMLKLRDTKVIDAGGRTMLPGLVDAHGHVMGLGFFALQLDLTGTRSLAELQRRLKDYATANPDARWILGRGWNQELWAEKRFPSSADIDAVVSDRPVWLTRVDGHAAVANSAAIQASGFTLNTQAPAGGRIENGLFVDAAMSLVESRIPAPRPEDYSAALEQAQQLMLANGLTAVADMGTSADDWDAMENAARYGRLNVRIFSYSAGLQPLGRIARNGPLTGLFNDHLSAVGVKLYSDGALGSRGAWLKRPYADKPDIHGLQFLTDAQLLDQATKAASQGHQLAIHAIGDAANAQVISTYEKLSASYGNSRRWRIEHVQIVDPADIPRLKPAGIIASMQPVHQTSDRTMAEARLDAPRLQGAYAWQTIVKSGVPLAFGSDFPVESPNPFPGLMAAVSRQDLNGQPPGGWLPQERVSFEQALGGFTRGAAYASFAEDKIGSLEPGKWADFVIVDRDVSRVDPQSLGRTQVMETWVAGKKVWERAVSGGAERGR